MTTVSSRSRPHALVARSFGNNLWFVAATQDGVAESKLLDQPPGPLVEHALSLLVDKSTGARPGRSSRYLALPNWGRPASWLQRLALRHLKGATLLFTDPDAAQRLGYSAYEAFRRLGVDRLVMSHPHRADEILDLSVSNIEASRQDVVERLRSHRLASFVHDESLREAKAASPLIWSPDGYFHTQIMGAFENGADKDFYDRYMVFEDDRQLPPLPRSHAEIAAKGDGRYSVYGGYLLLSPTTPERGRTSEYWVVSRDAPGLPVRLTSPKVPLGSPLALLEQPAPPSALQPGDKVVVCTHSLAGGGAERQWVFLAQMLAKAGYDVSFVVFSGLDGANSHYLPLLDGSGVKIVDASTIGVTEQLSLWPKGHDALALLKSGLVPDGGLLMRLTAAFRKIAPKVVYTQLDGGNLYAGLAAHLADAERVVLSFRNYNPSHFPYIYADWLQPAYQTLSRSPRVLYSGNHIGANDDYAAWIGIDPKSVAFIPNAIDPAAFPEPSVLETARLKEELAPGGGPIVLAAFRISAVKDPETFLRTFALVAARHSEVYFLHAGGGVTDTLRARAMELGLQTRLKFLGRRSDMPALLSVADIFLLSSLKEGMPNVVAEAQLMGTAVVGTRAGGTPDTVIGGETALLFDVGDAEGLASGISALLKDPERAKSMGAAGRRHVLSAFPKPLMAERYVALVAGRD